MELKLPNIIDLDYPMFPVSLEEREILNRATYNIMLKISSKNGWDGLCAYIPYTSTGGILKSKIQKSLDGFMYLHTFLKVTCAELETYEDYCLDWSKIEELRNYLRLVWITKLLNQDVKL